MAPPINVQDWYGDRHTCQIASGALDVDDRLSCIVYFNFHDLVLSANSRHGHDVWSERPVIDYHWSLTTHVVVNWLPCNRRQHNGHEISASTLYHTLSLYDRIMVGLWNSYVFCRWFRRIFRTATRRKLVVGIWNIWPYHLQRDREDDVEKSPSDDDVYQRQELWRRKLLNKHHTICCIGVASILGFVALLCMMYFTRLNGDSFACFSGLNWWFYYHLYCFLRNKLCISYFC